MKLYLVWNEAKTECVGFVDERAANYACHGFHWVAEFMTFTEIADEWLTIHCNEECTIQEIDI